MALKTNYAYPEFEGEKKYSITYNNDGTVSFTDATVYYKQGDFINASDINATNLEVMKIVNNYSGWMRNTYITRTDLQNATYSGKQKLRIIDNGDNTISFNDETVYTQQGSELYASDINDTNDIINHLNSDYTYGINQIVTALQSLGVSNPNDILGSIDQLAGIANTQGIIAGKQYVIGHASEFNLVTQQAYNNVQSQINTKKSQTAAVNAETRTIVTETNTIRSDTNEIQSGINDIKSFLTNYKSSIVADNNQILQTVNDYRDNYVSSVHAGQSQSDAMYYATDTISQCNHYIVPVLMDGNVADYRGKASATYNNLGALL